jgi:PIN domain nuclease of toxin-antitoxin system
LLAILLREPGGSDIEKATVDGAISAVNLCEVVAKLVDLGYADDRLRAYVERMAIRVHPFGADDAYAAGHLRRATQQAGLSLADRACLALAQRLRLPALTADRAWATLDLGVQVQVIR